MNGKEMRYDVPLYDGSTAQLWFPKLLTKADADRMVAFIDSLVIEGSTTDELGSSPEVGVSGG